MEERKDILRNLLLFKNTMEIQNFSTNSEFYEDKTLYFGTGLASVQESSNRNFNYNFNVTLGKKTI